MVKGHHLQLRYCLMLFYIFKWFNIMAAAAYQPVIQKEVEELLAMDANEPLTGHAGFY